MQNIDTKKAKKYTLKEKITLFFVVLFLPIILLIVLLYLTYYFLMGLWLCFLVKRKWISKGKKILFVYSNSPNWQKYIEENILPRIATKSIILNWSDRSQWGRDETLEFRVFRHWSNVYSYKFKGKTKWTGDEYNPTAVIFNSSWKPKVLRFWQAFKDYKHGNEKSLKELESQLFSSL